MRRAHAHFRPRARRGTPGGNLPAIAIVQGDSGNGSDAYVHPGIDSIAAVALDDRYRRKISTGCPASSARSEVGVSASHRPCTYGATNTSIPIIRNEELVLLRAEARW